MPKIQLTIKTSYLPSWGAYEGIRELVQNGRDAEVEHNAPLKVDWYNNTLRVENDGTTLPIKALLLGHTTKLRRGDLIGKFGEGLKLGVLALVRAGHAVKIRNGSEVWTPSIERSSTFDEDVLTFSIEGGRKETNRVRVEVGGVAKSDWEKMRERFLFLRKPKVMVPTLYGDLIVDVAYIGMVFVKGIFVQKDAGLRYGYNLKDAELDRDRKMIESYSLKYRTRNILLEALAKESETQDKLRKDFIEMLEEGEATEIETISEHVPVPEVAAQFVADIFNKKHGSAAVPVDSLAESKDVEHLGAKGVVVPKPLSAVLAQTMGPKEEIQERLKREVVRSYGWHELTGEEKASLEDAINLVDEASLDDVEVVDFRSATLLGQFKGGHVLVAKRTLLDREEVLATVIHEIAHRNGGDGDHGHVAELERLWKAVVRKLRDPV